MICTLCLKKNVRKALSDINYTAVGLGSMVMNQLHGALREKRRKTVQEVSLDNVQITSILYNKAEGKTEVKQLNLCIHEMTIK